MFVGDRPAAVMNIFHFKLFVPAAMQENVPRFGREFPDRRIEVEPMPFRHCPELAEHPRLPRLSQRRQRLLVDGQVFIRDDQSQIESLLFPESLAFRT